MKRKSNVEGGSVSKTARASLGKGKDDSFKASGDMDRIIPLANGEFAYILDPRNGRTYHLRVASESWYNIIEELLRHPDHGERILKELENLGWTAR